MKLPIRFFSIGLLTATIILLITFIFFEQSDASNNLTVEDMVSQIEEEGYHVLTNEEYITFSVNKDQNQKEDEDKAEENDAKDKEENDKTDDANENEEDDKDQDESKVHTYTLVVEPNMLGPTISKLLEDHKIIEDAEKFNRYLEVEGYAPYIQIGEHELSSDMSNYEIAETIARKR